MIEFVPDGPRDESLALVIGKRFGNASINANLGNGRIVFRAQLAIAPIPEVNETHRDVVLASRPQCLAQAWIEIFEKMELGTVFGSSCLQTIAMIMSMLSKSCRRCSSEMANSKLREKVR